MKPTSIRKKGKDYERELAKDIEYHLGGRAWRTPMSGAMWHNKADVNARYNIMERFHIEAKRQEKLNFHKAYSQSINGASNTKIPIVVCRRSNEPSMVFFKWDDFLSLMKEIQEKEDESDD